MSDRRISIEALLLGRVSAAQVISITAEANGMGEFFRKFTFGKDSQYSSRYVSNAVSRLKQKGYVHFYERDGHRYAELTPKGKKRLAEYQTRPLVVGKPKRWDGKWRIVMFDIPERLRTLRSIVRRELTRAGFVRLQNSVWVHAYDCEEYIALLKADQRIGKSLLYVVADRVEYDKPLKDLFNLS